MKNWFFITKMILGDDSKIYSKQSLKLLQWTFLPLPLELLGSYRVCCRKSSFGLPFRASLLLLSLCFWPCACYSHFLFCQQVFLFYLFFTQPHTRLNTKSSYLFVLLLVVKNEIWGHDKIDGKVLVWFWFLFWIWQCVKIVSSSYCFLWRLAGWWILDLSRRLDFWPGSMSFIS